MEAILKYNLPEDRVDFDHAVKAIDYYCALHDMSELLRRKIKHESMNMSADEIATWENAREEFNEILIERSIDI